VDNAFRYTPAGGKIRLKLSRDGDRQIRVDVADNGRIAMEMLETGDYNMILMDCQMPELDGFETTQAIRAQETGSNKRIPIIALTTNNLKSDRERCLSTGMDDFLSKPFELQDLALVLQRWLPDTRQVKPAATLSVSPRTTIQRLPDSQIVIDPKQIETMRELLGEDFDELIPAFTNSLEKILLELQSAIEQDDRHAITRHFHSIKSAAGNVGAARLSHYGSKLEKEAPRLSLEELSNFTELLAEEFATARDKLVTIE
jgi:CheY-like chemotaxis protein/HPt (histidine-containing phosphotransfer) domain-containing protein